MEFFHDSGAKPPEDGYEVFYDDHFEELPPEDLDYEDEFAQAAFTFNEILENCLIPTLEQGYGHIGKVIIWCAIFRVVTQTSSKVPSWLSHCFSVIIGLILLFHFFYTNVIYQVGLVISAWLILHISHKIGYGCRGFLSAILCVSYNMICELFFSNPMDWHQVRGAQMILSMKLISIAFDMDADISEASSNKKDTEETAKKEEEEEEVLSKKDARKRKFLQHKESQSKLLQKSKEWQDPEKDELMVLKVPRVWEYFGYALCPGTTLFGPWVAYKDYMKIFIDPRWV